MSHATIDNRLARSSGLVRCAGDHLPAVFVIAVVALFTLGPILFVVGNAIASGDWLATLANESNRRALAYSGILSVRAPLAAIIGFLIAWALIRLDLRAARFIEFSFWLAFFLPVLPITLSWILLLDPNYGLINAAVGVVPFLSGVKFDLYGIGGILWVHMVATSVPVMIVILGPALRQFDSSLEEVGRSCGDSPVGVLRKITLPLLFPAIATGALASFIRSLESFEVEQLLGRPSGIEVYSTRIYDLISWDPPRFSQAMTLSSLVLIVLFAIAALYSLFRRTGHATISVRGGAFHKLNAGWLGHILNAALTLFVLSTVYLSLAVLILGSFMRIYGFFHIDNPFTLRNWQAVLSDPLFVSAFWNSLVLAIGAAGAGVLIYGILGYLTARTQMTGRRLVEFMCWFPWLIPGVLLSVALLSAMLLFRQFSFLYGSVLSLILVIIVAQLPIGVQMMRLSFDQVPVVLDQSARICGAGPVRTFFQIALPLVRPMMASIFVLVFVVALRDIGTIIFLVGAGNQTLSVLSMQLAISSNIEGATVIGVITTALVVIAALLARRLSLAQ